MKRISGKLISTLELVRTGGEGGKFSVYQLSYVPVLTMCCLPFSRRKKSTDSATEDEPPSPPPIIFTPRIPRSVKRKQKASSNKTATVYLEDMPLPSPYNEGSHSNEDEDDNPFEEEEAQMTIGEMMEWRYIKAEQEKEKVGARVLAMLGVQIRLLMGPTGQSGVP
jgi:hypothetical protein